MGEQSRMRNLMLNHRRWASKAFRLKDHLTIKYMKRICFVYLSVAEVRYGHRENR